MHMIILNGSLRYSIFRIIFFFFFFIFSFDVSGGDVKKGKWVFKCCPVVSVGRWVQSSCQSLSTICSLTVSANAKGFPFQMVYENGWVLILFCWDRGCVINALQCLGLYRTLMGFTLHNVCIPFVSPLWLEKNTVLPQWDAVWSGKYIKYIWMYKILAIFF